MTLAALAFAPLSRLRGAALSARHEDDGYLDRWGAENQLGQFAILQLSTQPNADGAQTIYALTEAHSENLILQASWQRVLLGSCTAREAGKLIARFNRLADGLEVSPPHYAALPSGSYRWPETSEMSAHNMTQHIASLEHVAPSQRLNLVLHAMSDCRRKQMQDALQQRRDSLVKRYGMNSVQGDAAYQCYTDKILALYARRP